MSDITKSLRQIGEIQVNDWDFAGLLHKDLEVAESLRKLGNIKVNDWDFKSTLPKVHEIAHKEIDLPEILKRAAAIKVLDLDFSDPKEKSREAAIRGFCQRMRDFLNFIVSRLANEPEKVEFHISEPSPGVIRFRILLTRKDLKEVIGRDGATASAIRGLLKQRASAQGLRALLELRSFDEIRPGHP